MSFHVRIQEINEEDRPREILIKKGEAYLSNEQLLAVLINTGTIENSALDLAAQLLSQSGGLSGLSRLSLKEICAIKGLGRVKACKILAALELSRRISVCSREKTFQITSPQEVGRIYMEEMRHLKKELFRIVMLDTKNQILCSRDISQGSLNASIVHPREVFLEAIRQSSNTIILVHNHPSGDPAPSKEDLCITQRLCESGKLLGIEVLDHVIIGDSKIYSFRENGNL